MSPLMPLPLRPSVTTTAGGAARVYAMKAGVHWPERGCQWQARPAGGARRSRSLSVCSSATRRVNAVSSAIIRPPPVPLASDAAVLHNQPLAVSREQSATDHAAESGERSAQAESLINSIVTHRLIQFHAALVARGQIKPPPPGFGEPTADCTSSSDTLGEDRPR